MGKVIEFTGVTKLDLEPDRVLENWKGRFEGFVIVGFEKGGDQKIFCGSTYADGGTTLWLLEKCKKALLQ